MNIEEKAKAYDEALERARKQRDDYQKELNKTDKNPQLAGLLRAGISAIELAFPQLSESEDERIREELIGALMWQRDCLDAKGPHDNNLILPGFTMEVGDILEWLEKQKEQKPLTAEETELNSIAFLEQMGYTCIPPGKEQRLTESRKRNKPKESWLSKAKYEIEHADELLTQRQEELREIRELKNQEQKPICNIASDDAIESCMLRYLQSAANRKDDTEIIEDTKTYKAELISIIEKEQKPVLIKSDDKHMLERIMELVKFCNDKETIWNWLCEKIKAAEQKPAEWSDDDREISQNIMDFLKEPFTASLCPQLRKESQDWLKSLPERFNPQPNNEWSEEDRKMYKMLSSMIHGTFVVETQETQDKLLSWLKSLLERVNLQSKEEWSEEDEMKREGVIQWLREYQKKFNPKDDSLSIDSIDSLIDWFKSLRPSWKPSDEQIKALEECGECQRCIKELCEQRKRRM